MKNVDSISHVSGKSVYIDDIPEQKGTYYGVIYTSPIAHAKIQNIDYSKALKANGIIQIFTAQDIPGENQIGGIIKDEPLFAENEVHYIGQPIGLIVATTLENANNAKKLIEIKYEELEIVTDPRVAQQKGHLLFPSRTFESGNIEDAWSECEYVFEGTVENNGQEHLYIETQGSYAYPIDNKSIKIHSSTQSPTAVQKTAASILNLSMHRIEVDVARLGGAFGGKEDQASGFASMAALAAYRLQKPVKVILSRKEDLTITGKRHPYSSDFKIGLSKDLKIVAYKTIMYQNGGAATDLSPAIMERTLFHSTNAYYIPNTLVTVHSCKTNLPPNTAFRGFGAPQGVFAIESAIRFAANKLNVDVIKIQTKNFIKENQEFQFGQVAKNVQTTKSFQEAKKHFKLTELQKEIKTYNKTHFETKRGLSIMPLCFGISFTKTPLNQARSLVHVYQDGSVGISTAAIEMGQGVNTKIIQIASSVLGISTDKIKVESTNTTRVANTSPTAASTGADLNGHATILACNQIIKRLITFAAKKHNCKIDEIKITNNDLVINDKTISNWEQLIEDAFIDRVCLSENAHYTTPKIHFDKSKEKGHPFAYHVFGTAITTATVNCIKGTYSIDTVQIAHDFGQSMNLTIDKGQIEGALIQGIGWMTMEELSFNEKGKLLSNSLSTYKIPDIYSVPKQVEIIPVKNNTNTLAILNSKAVGEPPFLYGIGAYFAIQQAINSFNPNSELSFNSPYTFEKVLKDLY